MVNFKTPGYIGLYALAGLLFVGICLSGAPRVCASTIADQACDPQFLDAVESKGWLDGQREITQNQNLIFKPDSVLEYTCFTQFVNAVAVKAAPRFSEAPRWGTVTGINTTSTDQTLEQVVNHAFIAYLQANFPHTYRGGRLPTPPAEDVQMAPGDYVCDAMAYVWRESKCMRFMDKSAFLDTEPDIDGFYEFSFFRDQDTRVLPTQFAACVAATANYNLAMPAAYNAQDAMHVMPEENPNDEEPYVDDPLITRLEFLLPDQNCGVDRTPASFPVPTGVTVMRYGGAGADSGDDGSGDYEEHICLNPGCSYDGETCVSN